ncbi:MAG: hypothetical protein ACT4P2_03660 [Pseudomonadota bacterium]
MATGRSNIIRLQYTPDGSIVSHLRFALRHEPIDLGVLVAAQKAMDPAELTDWIRREPTGAYSHRAWFFYETITGRRLDLDPVTTGNCGDSTWSLDWARMAPRRLPRLRVVAIAFGCS